MRAAHNQAIRSAVDQPHGNNNPDLKPSQESETTTKPNQQLGQSDYCTILDVLNTEMYSHLFS